MSIKNEIIKIIDERIPVFKTFPSNSVIKSLPNMAIFETRGFYSQNDGAACRYAVYDWWTANSLLIEGRYIVPIDQENKMPDVYLPWYGIRPGTDATYAVRNSEILNEIRPRFTFGCTLRFPSGRFYFDRPIILSDRHLCISGSQPVTFLYDTSTRAATWLHFPNLTEGEAAISLGHGTLTNLIIYGNNESYRCTLDRTKTYTAPDEIVTEVCTVKAYGVKGGAVSRIQNVMVCNFYYGMYINTCNTYITDVNFNRCHTGLSIGNDVKVKGCYGWNIMTLLEMRGAISSAVQVRADSIGEHLVHIISGASIYLADLDADYCMKSVLHIGDASTSGQWRSAPTLVVNGIHGRCNCGVVYDKTVDTEPTAKDITEENYLDYGLITVDKMTTTSMVVTISSIGGANPLDTASNYLTPKVILSAGKSSNVNGSQFIFPSGYNCTKEFAEKYISQLSVNANNTDIRLTMPKGDIFIKKHGAIFTYYFSQGVNNVLFHGAKGDGSTDDTDSIKSVVDTFGSAYIPAGYTFAVNSTEFTYCNNHIYGEGKLKFTPLYGWNGKMWDGVCDVSMIKDPRYAAMRLSSEVIKNVDTTRNTAVIATKFKWDDEYSLINGHGGACLIQGKEVPDNFTLCYGKFKIFAFCDGVWYKLKDEFPEGSLYRADWADGTISTKDVKTIYDDHVEIALTKEKWYADDVEHLYHYFCSSYKKDREYTHFCIQLTGWIKEPENEDIFTFGVGSDLRKPEDLSKTYEIGTARALALKSYPRTMYLHNVTDEEWGIFESIDNAVDLVPPAKQSSSDSASLTVPPIRDGLGNRILSICDFGFTIDETSTTMVSKVTFEVEIYETEMNKPIYGKFIVSVTSANKIEILPIQTVNMKTGAIGIRRTETGYQLFTHSSAWHGWKSLYMNIKSSYYKKECIDYISYPEKLMDLDFNKLYNETSYNTYWLESSLDDDIDIYYIADTDE